MEDMCSNCGFYKIPPLFWGGSTEPLLCDCPKERSYSEDDLEEAFKSGFTNCYNNDNLTFGEWFEQFKKK